MWSARRLNPHYLFVALAISVSAIASFIAHSAHRSLVAAAGSLDLTLTLSAVWYWLLVRPGLRSKASLLFVALSGLWRASLLFPEVVPGKIWIGAACEFAIVATVIAGLRNLRAITGLDDADPVDRLRMVLARLTHSGIAAKAIASEFLVFYYAFAWRPKPHVPPGMQAFSLHERSGASVLIACVAALSLVEATVVHLILASRWSHTAAWIATGLSIWGAFWMLAMSRAFALRPSLVGPQGIIIRYGLLFRLHIPVGQIHAIDVGTEMPPGSRIVPKGIPPAVCIRFNEPLEAELILGFTTRVLAIGLSADDGARFSAALRELVP